MRHNGLVPMSNAPSGTRPIDAVCAYCPNPATTVDHVPPRNLFPTPPPPNLITVPACESCNNGASKDDEYFRSRLVLRADVAGEVNAQEAVQRVLRSLRRPQGRGFQQAMRKDITPVDLVTPSGILLGKAPAFRVDPRLATVPDRIARGLLFHHTRQRLPPGYGIRAFPLEQTEYASEQRRANLAAFLTPVTSTAPQQFGGVFTYWYSTVAEDPSASAWVMLFYGTALFVALTGPDQRFTEIERLLGA
jgi:hypothetical protein